MKKSGKHAIVFIAVLVTIFLATIVSGYIYSHKDNGSSYSVEEQLASSEPVAASDSSQEDLPQNEAQAESEPTPEPEPSPEPEPAEEPEPEKIPLPGYEEYLAVNPYVAGWLEIDGIGIDDPVVYTPGSQNYFLHRALDGSDSEKGTFFIAVNWQDKFHNTLIYGHNMKDGSGFGSLLKYADKNYGLKHNVIKFDTLYEEREYELLGVFYSQIEEDELETEEDREVKDQMIAAAGIAKKQEELKAEQEDETVGTVPGVSNETEGTVPTVSEEPDVTEEDLTVADLDLNRDFGDEDIYRIEKDEDNGRFRYYYYNDLADKDDYDYFVRSVKERSLYDTGTDAAYGDDLLTLSTCSYQVKNGRFVVVAVRRK